MRMIDGDELLKALDEHESLVQGQRNDLKLVENATLVWMYELINDAPTIDCCPNCGTKVNSK